MNGNLPTSRTRREFLRTAGAVLGSAVIVNPLRGQDHKSDFFDGVDAASLAVMEEARRQIEQVRKSDFSIGFLDGLVNGRSAGIRVAAPFRFDLSELLYPGNNAIGVRVANTLAPYYTVLFWPRTPGHTVSGLTSPVVLKQWQEP